MFFKWFTERVRSQALLHLNARDARAGDKFAEIEEIVAMSETGLVSISDTFFYTQDFLIAVIISKKSVPRMQLTRKGICLLLR